MRERRYAACLAPTALRWYGLVRKLGSIYGEDPAQLFLFRRLKGHKTSQLRT